MNLRPGVVGYCMESNAKESRQASEDGKDLAPPLSPYTPGINCRIQGSGIALSVLRGARFRALAEGQEVYSNTLPKP